MSAGIVIIKKPGPDLKVLPTLTAYEPWAGKLNKDDPGLELPTTQPASRVNPYTQGIGSVVLDSKRYDRLVEASPRLGGTLAATLIASLVTLLYRMTGQDQLVVGIPSDCHDDLANRCRNFLPMRIHADGAVSFKAFAATANKLIFQAYKHPGDACGSSTGKRNFPGDIGRQLAKNAVSNISQFGISLVQLDFETAGTSEDPNSLCNFDFFFNLILDDECLIVECEYNEFLIDKATIGRWLMAWEQLIESAINCGDLTLDELPVLPAKEAHLILEEWNATTRKYPRETSIYQQVSDVAALRPGQYAVRCGEEILTYADLESQSTFLAARLQAAGVKRGDLVGIHLERTCSMVTALLAILKCGAAYVPMDPAFPAERLRFMVEDAYMRVIISQYSIHLGLPTSNADILLIDQPSSFPHVFVPMEFHPEDAAYVIFTSGSTGRPKGVRIPHRALMNFLHSMRREPGLALDDVLLSVTTLSFDISGLEIFLPLITGAETIIATREVMLDGQLLAAAITHNNVTVLQATPSTWRLLLEAEWSGKSDLKILVGGEAVPRDLVNRLVPLCKEIWNVYGPTETTIWSTISRLDCDENQVSIGRPIDNTQVYIVNSSMQPQPIGVAGELLIGGDGLASGYHNLPELTANRFVDSPFRRGQKLYRTGDLARWTPDGSLECLGRMDHQVKVRGFRIELGEIETLMEIHPAVEQAVASVYDGKLITYFRVTAPMDSRSILQHSNSDEVHLASSLRNHLAAHLPEYMIPCAFVCLHQFPLTPNGKIDRKALPTPFKHGIAEDTHEVVAATNETEATLLKIWKQVLGNENIGIQDDIFEIGCDSISISQITSRATRSGIIIHPAQVFEFRTVAALASNCKFAILHPPKTAIQPVNRDRYRRRL
jgi:amino acid adenylation domain-containing protein